jgi:hypothetical protein
MAWSVLNTGLAVLGLGIGLLAIDWLIASIDVGVLNGELLVGLSLLGYLGLCLGTVALLVWLAFALQANDDPQNRVSPVEILLGHNLIRATSVLVMVIFGAAVVGIVVGITLQSWWAALIVGLPLAIYFLCCASLIAHASKAL